MVGKILTKFEVNWTSTWEGGSNFTPRPRSDIVNPNSEVEIGLISELKQSIF